MNLKNWAKIIPFIESVLFIWYARLREIPLYQKLMSVELMKTERICIENDQL